MNEEQQEALRMDSIRRKNRWPRIKKVMGWSPQEKKFRLFRLLWMRGFGPGWGAPANYSAKLSVGVEFRWRRAWIGATWERGSDRFRVWVNPVPFCSVVVHYLRDYGGWIP